MSRPTGVTILAILAIVVGLLNILAGAVLLGGAMPSAYASAAAAFRVAGIAALIIGLAYIVFAVGAFRLRPWAWGLGVVLAILTIVGDVLQLGAGSSGASIAGIVIAAIILVYLFQPGVRTAFGQRHEPTDTAA